MERKVLLFLIAAGIFVVFFIVYIALQWAPSFTLWLLGISVLALSYMFTEQWTTHNAVEYENRFWTLLAFLLARAVVVCEDSPLRFSHNNSTFAWVIIFIFTFLAHNYDRHLRRFVVIPCFFFIASLCDVSD
jgi:hypothetical protein